MQGAKAFYSGREMSSGGLGIKAVRILVVRVLMIELGRQLTFVMK